MFLTETIVLPYWLTALIHFHVVASFLSLFVFFQFFTFKKKKLHTYLGVFSGVCIYQSAFSAVAATLGIYLYSNLPLADFFSNQTYLRIFQSTNFAFCSLFNLTAALEIILKRNILSYSKIFFIFFVLSNLFTEILYFNKDFFMISYYCFISLIINCYAYYMSKKIFKTSITHSKQNLLHAYFATSSFLNILQGLFLGASSKILFEKNSIIQIAIGYLILPALQLIIFITIKRRLRT